MKVEIRHAVEDCLLRYTRGIDRLDGGLVSSAFHPGAELEGYGRHGTMTIETFVERAIPSLRDGYEATQHRLSNVSFLALGRSESEGNHVEVESYVLAFHVRPDPEDPDGPRQLLTFNGRYIDRVAERDGHWRIVNRKLRVDWTRIESIDETMPGDWIPGRRDSTDASYPKRPEL